MNRRTFTFASLALAGAASASEPVPQGDQAAPPAPKLAATWKVSAAPDVLTVSLVVANVSDGPLDVLVSRGSRPGPRLQAFVVDGKNEIALAELRDTDRREMMSRAGPIPRYEALVAGATVEVGPYQFTLPKGAEKERFRLVASVPAGEEVLTLEHTGGTGQV